MIWCACDSHSGDDLQLCAGSWTTTLSAHMVALHRFQTSLKELSTLPPIFSFKNPQNEVLHVLVIPRKISPYWELEAEGHWPWRLLQGVQFQQLTPLQEISDIFLLPCCGLTHQHNVRRKNTERMSHVLLKQIEQRAWLASGCPSRLVLEEPPVISTSGHQLPLLCLCGLSHAFPPLCMGGGQGHA